MSMAFKLKGLREQRGAIKAELEKLGSKLNVEHRAMSAEEKTAFDKLKTDWIATNDAIKLFETSMQETDAAFGGDGTEGEGEGVGAEGERSLIGRGDSDPRHRSRDDTRDQREYGLAWRGWARSQYGFPLTSRQAAACKRLGIDPRQRTFEFPWSHLRAMGTPTSGSGGGYMIAEGFGPELARTMASFSGVRGVAREWMTETGANAPWPTMDDTSNTGEMLSENTEVAYQDPTVSSITFGSYKFSSKAIIVSAELLQDSEFPVEAELGRIAGERLGRVTGPKYTSGTGSSEPKGVVTCASAGLTTATAAAFTADELTRLAHTVDPAYRESPSCGYMMKDDVLAYALMLKDSGGRPLLRESYAEGAGVSGIRTRVTCNGFPVFVNQHMTGLTAAVPVTATKHVLFGDFSRFVIRDVGTVRFRRLDERWAEKDQVGFIGFLRSDSNCVDTRAIKYMLQA